MFVVTVYYYYYRHNTSAYTFKINIIIEKVLAAEHIIIVCCSYVL